MKSRPGFRILAETGFDLLVATLQLRLRSFERTMARWHEGRASHRAAAPVEAAMVARALAAWDRRLPWRTRCFEQGIAAMRYLRRRGLEARLHYGARGDGEGMAAHVWVTSGETAVVGCDTAHEFRELRRFPAD